MMLPTHALVGLALAIPYALTVPELGAVALAAGFLGGVLPDVDLYADHRKALHYPVYHSAIAVALVPLAVAVPSPAVAAAAFLALGAAAHSVTDVVGGGLELRPWEGTSDRAVYDHYRDRWIAPRRWVRYDGAPEDLLFAVGAAAPSLVVLDGGYDLLVFAALFVAGAYAAVRRILPAVATFAVERVLLPYFPSVVVASVPDRYFEEAGEHHAGRATDGAR
ncbi:metal-dependent hydrolase [Halomicrobium salinisoli]|uniref:metal-dependent hydrolase n=1 Tax=Halomicrobium salinisoli TaxID=2878391 RepID=UPI001CF0178D|nr:metal-dependent hydrolase [Halomicrobium salinisoli]